MDFLWGKDPFKKTNWGSVNYLVGPNGTGKSLFVERLKTILPHNNLKVRYLTSDRLVDWTKQNHFTYGSSPLQRGLNIEWFENIKQSSKTKGEALDAFVLLRDNLDIRIKVESTISQLLNRTVILEEKGGYMNPKIEGKRGTYSFKENESHGLKEIITLITLLHDNSYNCFIIDEPELHLHPQYQSFFIQEIRKHAGNPLEDSKKKCFFIVTHSPHIVDIRTIDELKNVVIFQPNKVPTYIDEFSSEDEFKLNQLLPRLNTHHKQFFFSTRPVFVEGHTDQQIFSLIQEKRGKFVGSSGGSFIDVNGKDELDLFFRLCKKLSLDCQIIVDLDSIVEGKLRESVSSDERCKEFLQKAGISLDFFKGMHEIWSKLDDCLNELKIKFPSVSDPSDEMTQLYQAVVASSRLEEKRYYMILGIQRMKEKISSAISEKKGDVDFIAGRIQQIIEAIQKASVFILSRGELENYFEGIDNHYNLTANSKTSSFLVERDFLLSSNPNEIEIKNRYEELTDILDSVTKETKVDYKKSLLRNIQDFVYAVQVTSIHDGIEELDSLKNNKKINYDLYQSVIEILEYTKSNSFFKCKIKIKEFDDIPEKTLVFDSNSNPTKIEI